MYTFGLFYSFLFFYQFNTGNLSCSNKKAVLCTEHCLKRRQCIQVIWCKSLIKV